MTSSRDIAEEARIEAANVEFDAEGRLPTQKRTSDVLIVPANNLLDADTRLHAWKKRRC